jgi:hypothetical protein
MNELLPETVEEKAERLRLLFAFKEWQERQHPKYLRELFEENSFPVLREPPAGSNCSAFWRYELPDSMTCPCCQVFLGNTPTPLEKKTGNPALLKDHIATCRHIAQEYGVEEALLRKYIKMKKDSPTV